MSSPNTKGDPRAGRDRHLPSRNRTFKDGQVDPVIATKRPLLTVGNVVLLVIGVGFGMYATGNLPQLDAFFDHLDAAGKAHNTVVVSTLITYGTVIFGVVLLGIFGLILFAFVNAYRRRASDPKGWRKLAKSGPQPRKISRRIADLPSLILPVSKARPDVVAHAAVAVKHAPAAAAALSGKPEPAAPVAAQTPAAATPPTTPASSPTTAKLAAMQAAAKAQAATDAQPDDKPSFVRPYGKARKPQPEAKRATEAVSLPLADARHRPEHDPKNKVIVPAAAAEAKAEPAEPLAPAQSVKPVPTTFTTARLAAMEAAAKAEAAADAASDDKPSFVMPYGKVRKPNAS